GRKPSKALSSSTPDRARPVAGRAKPNGPSLTVPPLPAKLAQEGPVAAGLSRGPSAWVGIRNASTPVAVAHPDTIRLQSLIDRTRATDGHQRVAAANELLDGVKDYLGQRPERVNRSGDGYRMLAGVPVEERVPMLRRSIHALRRATKDGVLPSRTLDTLATLARLPQGVGSNFDWDDNIANMSTRLVLFNTKDSSERELRTDAFAVIREKLGQPGEWADWEVRGDDHAKGSFRNFRDYSDASVFARDLAEIRETPNWRGPAFADFQKAMAHEATARWSTIITARGHYPNTIHAALEDLKRDGVIRHVPPEENIFPVTLPGLAERLEGAVENPSEAKIKIMERFLDRLDAAPFGPSSRQVTAPDGGPEREYLHLWGFSDDDHGTFAKAKAQLGKEVAKGRWPNVKITLFFTGQNHPEVEPHAVVIQPNGRSRAQLPEEIGEVDKVIDRIAATAKALSAADTGAPLPSAPEKTSK
ncbi:MAG: hypothetical protein AAFZ18_29015, partial [Myxococcota bacterium]